MDTSGQRSGRLRPWWSSHRQSFLDITRLVNSSGGEQGLLSMAFAPDYARSGRFYVYYTDSTNNLRIVQYARAPHDPNRAQPASARTVLTIDHHSETNHDGGQLQFGPDGALHVGVGDGGSEGDPHNYGQNTNVLVGKLLRISPKPSGGFTIPAGNPFAGQGGNRQAIWAYGLRNPWRFSFDRLTGDLVIGDVGQDKEEEIDFARKGFGRGANYGWSVFEGDHRYKPGRAPGAVAPALVLHHSDGYCALVGGYVVRDRSLPRLYGRYLYGDNCKPQISSVRLTPGRAIGNGPTGLSVSGLSSFGQDTLGRIYAVSLAGPVYRLAERYASPPRVQRGSADDHHIALRAVGDRVADALAKQPRDHSAPALAGAGRRRLAANRCRIGILSLPLGCGARDVARDTGPTSRWRTRPTERRGPTRPSRRTARR